VTIKIDGLDKLQNRLKQMEEAAKELEKGESVPFSVLFSSVFMGQYTQFNSFEDFLSAGGFEVNSQEDFEAIPDEAMDTHVAKTTKFGSWDEMLSTAGKEYVEKKLGF